MDVLEIVKDLSITAIGSFIGFYGAYIIFKRQEKERIKHRHFETLKFEVLRPWMIFLSIKPKIEQPTLSEVEYEIESDFNCINKQLFNDLLENHYSKLQSLKKSFEQSEKEFEERVKFLKEIYRKKYESMKAINPWSIAAFFVNESKQFRLFHEKTNLFFSTLGIAAGNENELGDLKKVLEKDYDSEIGIKTRTMYNEIKKWTKILESEIEMILAKEKIQGKCSFID